jgi:selenocysteine lyase/cysteine desulfurase
VIGSPEAGASQRVPTLSFVVKDLGSDQIPPHLDSQRIGLRSGHFYAPQLIEALGLGSHQGVVRVSMVHYNTLEECDRLVDHLSRLF